MLKRMAVLICGFGVILMTSGPASAQAVDTAKQKTKAAVDKTGQVLSDAEITTAVKTKLLADKTVGGLKIDVDTKDGVVTLTGPVNSAAERHAAVRIARETKGVKSVTNKLTLDTAATTGSTASKESSPKVKVDDDVKKNDDEKAKIVIKDDTTPKVKAAGRKIADAEITTSVKTKLLTVKDVIANDINVDTNEGVVTLKGSVPTAAQKTRAAEIARNTAGVKSVVNELSVQK
jgi:hyperosmotically inducible periplasmic protein